MKIYRVGGAVRDQLLDIPYQETDWVVVGATPQEMQDLGFKPADREFPVFLHPQTGEEYALARTETKVAPGYKGFEVCSDPGVTLEEDLLRRDLTINALAMDDEGRLIDVCHGRRDLDDGVLRHVTPAFVEDPVRLLRIARFAAKLGCWGFRVAHATHRLMVQMASEAELRSLTPERVMKEMLKAMAEPQPWRFFEVLQRCGALPGILPELAEILPSQDSAHADEVRALPLEALKRAVQRDAQSGVRTAVLLLEVAKRREDVTAWLQAWRIERATGQLIHDLLGVEGLFAVPGDAAAFLRFIQAGKLHRQSQRYRDLLMASSVLWPEREALLLPRLVRAHEVACAETPQDLLLGGLSGRALGDAIQAWREARLRQVWPDPDTQ
ncbi:MAG: multifunctional CCA tRNA nucleotidyl transferase/2'3'-cyclic phosphodiesterase/2'nucleotidase/phosphatase [Candidatus Thiodiazotropha sp.]